MTPDRILSRRTLLQLIAGGAATAALPACAQAPSRSPRPAARPLAGGAARLAPAAPVNDIITRARLGGTVGYAVIDMQTGRMIESAAETRALPPASVTKAVTALYALDALGPAHRFRTRLTSTGSISGGVLQGDLVLAGGGDPVLDTDALAGLAAALRARGVQRVSGRFLVDDSALPAIARIANDQPVQAGYNATISGLNLNFNRVHFSWRRSGGGYAVAMDARSARLQPVVGMAEMQVINRRSPVYTFASDGGRDRWTVAQAALGNSGARWLPVRQPGLYAADVFRTLAAGQGVTLPAGQTGGRAGGTVLAEHQSDPLPLLIRDMLRFSTNITAEALGLAASTALGVGPRSLAHSAQAMNQWARQRYGLTTAGFTDHSGLGADAGVSMADLARFFARSGTEGTLPELLRDHEMRDANGNAIRNHPLTVRAKTGTLNFVSALGGVVEVPGGRQLAFAISASDLPRRAGLPDDQRERPEGGVAWTRRARRMQQELIERWAALQS